MDDITIELTPVLLKDLMDGVTLSLHHGIKNAAKVRLTQWHLYAAGRKSLPRMKFTFSIRLLRDIVDAVSISCSRDDLEKVSRNRLLEWKEIIVKQLPAEEGKTQTRLKI